MLLIGMKTNLIRYPTTPITAKPIAQYAVVFFSSYKKQYYDEFHQILIFHQ